MEALASGGGPFVGEIRPGERTEHFDRLTVVRPGRFDLIREEAKEGRLALAVHRGKVLAVRLTVAHALEPGGRPLSLGSVAHVLLAGADPQIGPGVVEFVAVLVIDDHPRGRLHDLAVHEDRLAVLAPGGIAVTKEPAIAVEPLIIRGVHKGVVAPGQGNSLDVAFGRGGFGAVVAADPAGGHRPHPAGEVGLVGTDGPVREAGREAGEP